MTDFANRVPPGEKGQAKKSSGCLPALGIFFGVLVIGGIFVAVTSDTNSDSDYDSNTSYEAIAQCESRIERELKSPSTSEFDTSATGSGTWTVNGTVDSENSFGAMVRNTFQCTVEIVGDGATTTIDFIR